MTFDLYNFQKPHSPGGRLWEFAQETLGLKKIIVLKIPWLAHSLFYMGLYCEIFRNLLGA